MTRKKMKQILTKEIPWYELNNAKNKGIFEFFSKNKKSLGVSYEDIDDQKDVYIYNIFIGDEYINIYSRGTKENPIPDDVLTELVEQWNNIEDCLNKNLK